MMKMVNSVEISAYQKLLIMFWDYGCAVEDYDMGIL